MAISPQDLRALVLSFVYCAAAIGAAELIRKIRGYGDEFTRKLVHVTIGLWIIPTLLLFQSWYWAAALPALAVVGNFLSQRMNILRGIERADRHDFGTVFFPLSFVICIFAYFNSAYPVSAAAGIIPMALGDAAAAVVGNAFGRRPYIFLGAKKTLEGSAAMLVVSAVTVFTTLLIFKVSVPSCAIAACLIAAVATLLEAAGKNGLDNLTVPVVCSTIGYFLLVAFEGAPR